MRKNKIITIDGPSGAGKSTIAKLLASTEGYTYIDSGAIYRGIAYAYKVKKDGGPLEEFLRDLPLSFDFGQLTRVSEIISGMGANVVSVQYDLADPNMTVTSCFLKLGLETRDHTQIEQIKAKLTEEGFKLVSERA